MADGEASDTSDTSDTTKSTWVAVLGPDATVLAVSGAPVAWVGTRLDLREDVVASVREAAAELTRAIHHPGRATVAPQLAMGEAHGSARLRLVAIEAIAVRRAPVDLRALLASTMEVMIQQARALDIDLRVEHDKTLPRAVALDAEKIAWAVSTLVGNALRYVRQGTRLRPGGTIGVHLGCAEGTGDVVLSVQDDGPGIPAEKLPNIFTRDVAAIHTVGVALMLVHDVVTAHGGSVDVASSTDAYDHGTTITLRFPVR
jgi:signal transduction histidine kinase